MTNLVPRGTTLPSPNYKARRTILGLQDAIARELPSVLDDLPLYHHFAPGQYGRELRMPKGTIIVGKIHKHAHINVLSKGRVAVVTEQGREVFEAPRTWVSTPGTKRAVYVLEDCVWTTVHVTDKTDLQEIEDEIIAPSYEEFDKLMLEELEPE